MKDKKHLINIVPVMIVLFSMLFLNLFFGNKEEISQTENRKLAQMPKYSTQTLKSGEYFAGLDSYISDNFFQRELLIKQNGLIKILTCTNVFATADRAKIIQNPQDGGKAIAIKNDNVFFIAKHNYDNIKLFGETINQYQDVLKNIPVSLLVAPTAYEFINDRRLKANYTPQSEALDYVKSNLNKSVNYIDVYNTLSIHRDEYLYFKSDHHWTSLGAYYAYSEFIKAQNKNPINLSDSPLKTMGEFTGSFYNYTNDERVNEIKDEISIYIPKVKYECFYNWEKSCDLTHLGIYFDTAKINYQIFLGGDYGFTKIETENKNAETIMVIKDSYANAFIQYLIEHYNKIIIIDPRYFQEKIVDVIKGEGVDCVLCVNNIETLSDINFINNLKRILH